MTGMTKSMLRFQSIRGRSLSGCLSVYSLSALVKVPLNTARLEMGTVILGSAPKSRIRQGTITLPPPTPVEVAIATRRNIKVSHR